MPPTESAGPLNAAHQHAANADENIAQGLLVPAAEEHRKAAEAFASCIDQSGDENAKRTLRMLHNEHTKAAKELERRIAKLREDGIDPALPQKPTPQRPRATAPQSPAIVTARMPPPTSPSPPPQAHGHGRPGWTRMSESQGVGDESFMVLGGRSQSDPGDAFNQFWKIMEGMMDRLSQPVAFASAPLDRPPATSGHGTSSSSDTDMDDYATARRSGGLGKSTRGTTPHAGLTQFPPPRIQPHTIDLKSELDEVLADDDDELAESFCVIPSTAPSKPSPAAVALQQENSALKAELEAAKARLVVSERAMKLRMEHDKELMDSIIMAKREAQRAMASSVMVPPRASPNPNVAQIGVDLGGLNLVVPPPMPPMPGAMAPGTAQGPGRDREGQLVRRVRELEEEVRVLKADNEKQKAMIVRFREKWEKLKENSKKKKSARAAAEVAGSVREKIDEDPEAEEAAAEEEGRPSSPREKLSEGSMV